MKFGSKIFPAQQQGIRKIGTGVETLNRRGGGILNYDAITMATGVMTPLPRSCDVVLDGAMMPSSLSLTSPITVVLTSC